MWGQNLPVDGVLGDHSAEGFVSSQKTSKHHTNPGKVTVDLNEGVISNSSDGFIENIYNMFTGNGYEFAEPGKPTEYVLVTPMEEEVLIKHRKPLIPITTKIDTIVVEKDCDLSEVEAVQYLCERGIDTNEKVNTALRDNRYCLRELNKSSECSVWKKCTKKVVLNHFSTPLDIPFLPYGSYPLGNGMYSSIPQNMCHTK